MAAVHRPGFVPEVRLRLVDPMGNEAQTVTATVSRLTADLVHHGASKVELVLNNNRYTDDQRHGPALPPWRYNDLQAFGFGKHLRVDLRYLGGNALDVAGGGEGQRTIRQGTAPPEDGWMPLIHARVVDLKFAFTAAGPSELTVTAEDLLSLLKVECGEQRTFQDKDEAQILEELLQFEGQRPLLPARVTLPDLPPFRQKQLERSQTRLAFVMALAEPLDYEVFAAYDDPADPDSTVRLHFEAARSGTLDTDSLVDLVWGLNLLSMAPTFRPWQVCTSVHAQGRDPRTGRRTGDEGSLSDPTVVRMDLQHEREEVDVVTAVDVRRAFGDAEPIPRENPNSITVSNLDPARARLRANAELLKSARQFLTAEIDAVGMPQLRPGIHVKVDGLRPPFDGVYYVTKVRQTLDDNGFRSHLTVRRPGYTDPQQYLGSEHLVAAPEET